MIVPGRRRARAEQTQNAAASVSAGELAVQSAEEIVGRAWAEQLLRYYDRMDRAFDLARERYENARGRLVSAQRAGDPGEISVAHDVVQRAFDACRSSEAAREQGRQALQAALDALARTIADRIMDAPAEGGVESRVEGGGDLVTGRVADVGPGSSIWQAPADGGGGAGRVVWRTLRWFGRRRGRRGPGLGRP